MTPLVTATTHLSIVLAAALAASVALRRRSAATRHAVVAAALLAGAAAPAIDLVVPTWELPVTWGTAADTVPPPLAPAASGVAPSETVVVEAGDVRAAVSVASVVTFVWLAGALVTGAGLLTGLVRLARLRRRCLVITVGPWRDAADRVARQYGLSRPVALLQSRDPALLLTWGLLRPKILLPAGAGAWSDARRDVVLAHEIAHIRRRDWALHLAAEAVRTVHWFNPLVWITCRRLHHFAECAADDGVLDGGAAPTMYASHLLAIARESAGHRHAWAPAPGVVHPSRLERRIAAMLNRTQQRGPLTRRAVALALAAALAVTIPLAAIGLTPQDVEPASSFIARGDTADIHLVAPAQQPVAPPLPAPPAPPERPAPTPVRAAPSRPAPPAPPPPERAPMQVAPAPAAPQGPATVTGIVDDPTGGVLPGVQLALADARFVVRYTTFSESSGRFTFRSVQPGRYYLTATLAGFATVTNVADVAPGASTDRRITLPLAALEESVTIVCSATAARAGTRLRLAAVVARGGAVAHPSFALQAPAAPVRVGGAVRPPDRISGPLPECPVAPGDETLVMIEGRIGTDGSMHDVRHVPGGTRLAPPAPELVEAALEAVREWTYTPARLNGRPADVTLRLQIRFSQSGARPSAGA